MEMNAVSHTFTFHNPFRIRKWTPILNIIVHFNQANYEIAVQTQVGIGKQKSKLIYLNKSLFLRQFNCYSVEFQIVRQFFSNLSAI